MTEVIEIGRPIKELCEMLGLVPDQVKKIVFEPTRVQADVYLLNENGQKYINATTQEVAIEWRDFKVTTFEAAS